MVIGHTSVMRFGGGLFVLLLLLLLLLFVFFWGGGGGDCMFGVGWWVVLTPLSPSIQLMSVVFEHSVLRIQEIYGLYVP